MPAIRDILPLANSRCCGLVLWCSLFLSALPGQAGSVHAQEVPAGAIVGEVRTDDGALLDGVAVELSRVEGPALGRQFTGSDGRFLFVGVPAGRYALRVQHPGFRPAEREDVRVRSGATTRVDVTLSVAPVQLEDVQVIVSPVTISRTGTEFTTKLDETQIELLPVRYDPKDLVSHTAGARPGHVWGGATAQANNYQLDGVAANHPGIGGDLLQPSISWIESIEVRGLGSGAEYGNFQGGLIDITTKSGTNRFEGAVRVGGETEVLNASNLGRHEIGSETRARYDIEGELRGPLVKDRLFYFVAGHWLGAEAQHLNHLRQFDGRFLPTLEERNESKFFGKLTWRPTDADHIDLTAGRLQAQVDHYGQTGYEAPAASWRLTVPTTFYGARWRHNWGSLGLVEAKVAAFTRDEERTPYAGDTVPAVQMYGLRPPYATYQNAPLRLRHAPESVSGSLGTTLQFATWGVQHLLKVGAEYSRGSFVDERIRTGGMTWRPAGVPSLDPADPSTWPFSSARIIPTTWGGEVRLHSDVENGAAYLQDYITVSSRLSVSPGVRYGGWRGWITPGGGTGVRFLAVQDAAVEPRIGVTIDVTGENTLVAKGHWGRYHQNLLSQMFDRVAGADVFSNEQLWYYRGQVSDPRTPFSVEERDRLAREGVFTLEEEIVLNETGPVENYRQPFVDQWVVGLEKTIAGRVKLEALYVNRRNRQMVALIDRNRESNYTVFEHVRVYDASGEPILFSGMPLMLRWLYVPHDVLLERMRLIAAGDCDGCLLPPGMSLADTARLSYDPDYVLTNVPDARREFDQLQLSVEASLGRWGASGSVVFTGLKGNLDNVTGYDDPAGFGAGPYVRVNESVHSYGSLSNFADRELKASVYGQLPWGLRGGVFWQYAVGDHYSPQFTLSGLQYRYTTFEGAEIDHRFLLPLAGHTVFVVPRGNRQYRVRATVDARLEREFSLGGGAWVVTLDGFNIFNAASVTEHNTSVNRGKNYYHFLPGSGQRLGATDPNDYYQAVRERVSPRVIRVGTSVRF